MHYGDQVWNWIAQIKFGFKPKFGIMFGFNFGFSGSVRFKTLLKKRDLIVTLNFALIRF